jgi:hypothetical protein
MLLKCAQTAVELRIALNLFPREFVSDGILRGLCEALVHNAANEVRIIFLSTSSE